MTAATPGGRPAGLPGDDLLAAWLDHEEALWARLSVERHRAERRALWRALADARQLLERIDPARGGHADALRGATDLLLGTDEPFPPSVEQVLASHQNEWDVLLDQLGQGPGGEPDAAP